MQQNNQLVETLKGVFLSLEKLQFTAANEGLKALHSQQQSPAAPLLPTLLLLSMCEAQYHSLAWLEVRWIRKDHLGTMLSQLAAELRKLDGAQPALSLLARQLLALVLARQEMAGTEIFIILF